MCTGVEIALLAAGAVSAGAAVMQGQQAKETADTNAELQRRQGEADKDAAVAQAEKIRKAQRYAISQANAANAASGLAVGEGSAVKIDQQIYKNSEDDAFSTLLTGTRRARNDNTQAGISEWQGGNAQTAGYLNATASLLSTGAKVGSGWKSTSSTAYGINMPDDAPNRGGN